MKVNQAGVWKNATPHCKVGGTWVKPKEVWVKHAGVWKKEWSNSLFELTVTANGLSWSGDANNKTETRGFDVDIDSYSGLNGGTVTPTTLGEHPVLSAYVSKGTGDNWANYWVGEVIRLSVPIGAGGSWLNVRGVIINGVLFQGRFLREYDIKSGQALAKALFYTTATSNDLGYTPVEAAIYTPEQKAAINTLINTTGVGGKFTLSFV